MLQRKPTQTIERDRAQAVARGEAVLNLCEAQNRGPTDDEKTVFDAALQEIERIDRIDMRSLLHGDRQPDDNGMFQPIGGAHTVEPYRAHTGKLHGFKSPESAYRSGQWLKAQLLGDPQSARWCKDAGMPMMAASEGINTAGGYLVPSELSSSIIALMDEYGLARSETRVVGMSSDTLDVPRRTGGLTPYFVGENIELTESDASWDNVKLTAKKLAVLTRMSSEVSEDAIIDLASWLSQEVARAFSEREDECLFNGDGTVTYGGMQGITVKLIDGNHAAGAVAAAGGHNLLSEVDLADLQNVMAALPQYAHRGAKWYCSPVSWALIFEALMAATNGNAITDFAAGAPKQFMGYPVVITPSLPTATTDLATSVVLLFGNMQQAVTMGDRRQIRLMVSEHRYYELDQIGLRGTERFDINVHDLGDGTTAGPLVGLVATA